MLLLIFLQTQMGAWWKTMTLIISIWIFFPAIIAPFSYFYLFTEKKIYVTWSTAHAANNFFRSVLIKTVKQRLIFCIILRPRSFHEYHWSTIKNLSSLLNKFKLTLNFFFYTLFQIFSQEKEKEVKVVKVVKPPHQRKQVKAAHQELDFNSQSDVFTASWKNVNPKVGVSVPLLPYTQPPSWNTLLLKFLNLPVTHPKT